MISYLSLFHDLNPNLMIQHRTVFIQENESAKKQLFCNQLNDVLCSSSNSNVNQHSYVGYHFRQPDTASDRIYQNVALSSGVFTYWFENTELCILFCNLKRYVSLRYMLIDPMTHSEQGVLKPNSWNSPWRIHLILQSYNSKSSNRAHASQLSNINGILYTQLKFRDFETLGK